MIVHMRLNFLSAVHMRLSQANGLSWAGAKAALWILKYETMIRRLASVGGVGASVSTTMINLSCT